MLNNKCETIHSYLKNKIRKDAQMKFYKTAAVPTFMYAPETWNLSKGDEMCIRDRSCLLAGTLRKLKTLEGMHSTAQQTLL